MTDSFKARSTLKVGDKTYDFLSLAALKSLNVDRLPFSLKILLENLLRFEDGVNVTKNDIEYALYDAGNAVESNTTEVAIYNLRKKLGADFIKSIRGVGYMIGR